MELRTTIQDQLKVGKVYRWILVLLIGGLFVISAFVAVVLSVSGWQGFVGGSGFPVGRAPRNLVVMVADGFGPAAETMVRDALGARRPMPLDRMVRGTLRTGSGSSLVTDSAAGATAYSCGLKTTNEYVAVTSEGLACGTIMEAARKHSNKRIGVVVKSSVTNATPASFTAHAVWRWMEQYIAVQQISAGLHVMFGGGQQFFLPKGVGPGVRTDGRNLLDELRSQGVQVVQDDVEAMRALTKGPAVALFGALHMDYVIDRPAQPSLAEMTLKALDLLTEDSSGSDGFVLLVEGSRIDMAAHYNDAATQLLEIEDYEQAVKAVVDWAEADGNTEVLSVADHETGGLSLGVAPRDGSYPVYNWWPEKLARVNASAEVMAERVFKHGACPACQLRTHANVNLTEQDWQEIRKFNTSVRNLAPVLGRLASYPAGVGYSTPGHTACDVLLHTYNMDFSLLPSHNLLNLENSEIGEYLIRRYSFNVQEITDSLKHFNVTSPFSGDS